MTYCSGGVAPVVCASGMVPTAAFHTKGMSCPAGPRPETLGAQEERVSAAMSHTPKSFYGTSGSGVGGDAHCASSVSRISFEGVKPSRS